MIKPKRSINLCDEYNLMDIILNPNIVLYNIFIPISDIMSYYDIFFVK
jgi:hypothetical protein